MGKISNRSQAMNYDYVLPVMTPNATVGSRKEKLKHKEYEPQKLPVLNKQPTKETGRGETKRNFDIQNILL